MKIPIQQVTSRISQRISLIVYENHLPILQEWKRVVGILSIFDENNAEDWPKDNKLNIEGNWFTFPDCTFLSRLKRGSRRLFQQM